MIMKTRGVSEPPRLLHLLVTLSLLSPVIASTVNFNLASPTVHVDYDWNSDSTTATPCWSATAPGPAAYVSSSTPTSATTSLVYPEATTTALPSALSDSVVSSSTAASDPVVTMMDGDPPSANSVTSSLMPSGPASTESAVAFSSWKAFSTLVMSVFTSSEPTATVSTEHSQTTITDDAGPIPSDSAPPAASSVRLEIDATHSIDSPSRTNDGNAQQQPTKTTGHDEQAHLHYDAIANILFTNQSLSADDHAIFELLSDIRGKKIASNGTDGKISLENALLFRIGGPAPLPAVVTEAKRVGGFLVGPRIGSYQLEWVVNKVYQTQKLPEICLPTYIVQKIQGTFEKVELTLRSLKDIEQRKNNETLCLQQNNEKLEAGIEHNLEFKAQLEVKEEHLMQWEANLEGVLEPYFDIILIESCLIAFLIFLLFKRDPFITSIRSRPRRSEASASSVPRNAPTSPPQDKRSRSWLSRIVSSYRQFKFTAVLRYYIPTMSTIITRSPVACVISAGISLFHFVKLKPAMKTATKWVKKLFVLRLSKSNKSEATSSVQSTGRKAAAPKPTSSHRQQGAMSTLTHRPTTYFKRLVSLLRFDLLLIKWSAMWLAKKLFGLGLWKSNKSEATSSVQSKGKKGAARRLTPRRMIKRTMRRLAYLLTTSLKRLVSLLQLDLLIATFIRFAYHQFKILVGIRDTAPKRSGKEKQPPRSRRRTRGNKRR